MPIDLFEKGQQWGQTKSHLWIEYTTKIIHKSWDFAIAEVPWGRKEHRIWHIEGGERERDRKPLWKNEGRSTVV